VCEVRRVRRARLDGEGVADGLDAESHVACRVTCSRRIS
jgi:hypothetical protein